MIKIIDEVKEKEIPKVCETCKFWRPITLPSGRPNQMMILPFGACQHENTEGNGDGEPDDMAPYGAILANFFPDCGCWEERPVAKKILVQPAKNLVIPQKILNRMKGR